MSHPSFPPPTLNQPESKLLSLPCTRADRDELHNLLGAWREDQWKSIASENPGLSRSWVISDMTISRLVDKANWIAGSHVVTEELLDWITEWLANSDETIEELVKILNQFWENVHTR